MTSAPARRPARPLRLLRVWGPVVVVMAVIFVASSWSSPPRLPARVSDLAAHAAAYAVLAAAMLRAVTGADSSRITAGGVLLAVVLTVAYGVSDEVHQSFVPDGPRSCGTWRRTPWGQRPAPCSDGRGV